MVTIPNWVNGVHHDGSEVFVSPSLPKLGDSVTFRMRTPIDAPIKKVYQRAMRNGEFHYVELEKQTSNDVVTWWSCAWEIEQTRIDYVFMLVSDDGAIYINARGASFADSTDNDSFTLITDYDAPLWVRDAVYYQIFSERFGNGDQSNDVQDGEIEQFSYTSEKREWGEEPYAWKDGGNLDFFGGDLQGITQNLDYLVDLGITGIYMTPIFTAESNHKYDIQNYFDVDKHFGGNEALVELREASRERDMTLMLDITPNHCSFRHPWVTDFKDNIDGDTSEFFYYDAEKDVFETWLGVPSLIKLNYASQRLRDVMYRNEDSAIQKWLRPPYSIDAWRLDVANMTGNQDKHQFDHEVWREMRDSIREANKDAYILGEYFQDGTAHLQGDELDASMNYQGFNMPMRRWLVPESKQVIDTDNVYAYKPAIGAEVMAEQWQNFMGAIPYPIVLQQFNQLDSHDVPRILSVVFDDVELVKLGTALMMGFPGVPCLYYGHEIEMDGEKEPLNRQCMRWDESTWNQDLLDYCKQVIAIRKESHAMKHGGFKVLLADGDVIAFARESDEQLMIVVGYRGDAAITDVALDVAQLGLEDGMALSDLITEETFSIVNSEVVIPTITHGQTLYLAMNKA